MSPPANPSPAPSASFAGLEDNGTELQPDTQGAVGPNHLMVTLNTGVRIQNRAGGVISTMSLNSFWATTNAMGQSLGNPDAYQPRVVFDPLGDRFIFVANANPVTNVLTANPGLLIAVSQTDDPTGNWFRYFIDVDTNTPVFADSPNVGFNKNWIGVQANMFYQSNTNFQASAIYVLNKTNFYAGGAGLYRRFLPDFDVSGASQVPAATYDNAQTTLYLVNTFIKEDNNGFGRLGIHSVSGPIGSETFTTIPFEDFPGVDAWSDTSPGDVDFGPQLGSTNKIHLGDDRVQQVVFRNGLIWSVQTVFVPSGGLAEQSAVQWLQFSPGGIIFQAARIVDEATNNFTMFAYPSVAVNRHDDALIGYSRFSGSQYASANYSFRFGGRNPIPADPLDTLRADRVLNAGEASYSVISSGINRWGDLSAATVDPRNDTDLWTLQEYAATPSGGRDRWGTWWGRISPPYDLGLTLTDAPDPATNGGTLTYTLVITNHLMANVSGIKLTNTLPGNVAFVSASLPGGTCSHSNGVVTCDLDLLSDRAKVTATISVTPMSTGQITNTAVVSANGDELNLLDNNTSVATTINPSADLAVIMTDSPDPVLTGNNLTYFIIVTNRGPNTATLVAFTNNLPSSVTFVSSTNSQGSCTNVGTVVRCSLGSISSGADARIGIVVTATTGGLITNRANVKSALLPDVLFSNNAATNSTRVVSPPTISNITDKSTNEDTSTPAISFTIGPPAASLTLSRSSSNTNLVANANIVFGGSGASRTVTITPLPDQTGTTTITVTVTDGDGLTASDTFLLTVNPVNDPPTISDIANPPPIDEDAVTGPSLHSLPQSFSDIANSGYRFLLMGVAGHMYALEHSADLVQWTPFQTNLLTSSTMEIVDTTASSAPIRFYRARVVGGGLSFTVGDVETDPGSLTLSKASSNPTLIPTANIVFGGSGANRTVTAIPAINQFGTATITVTVSDGVATNSDTFVVTVNSINDVPTISSIAAQNTNEDTPIAAIPFTVGDVETPAGSLTLRAISVNEELVSTNDIIFGGSGANRTVTIRPLTNQFGSASIVVRVTDANGAFADTFFDLNVNSINDAPTVSTIPNQFINQDSSTPAIPFTIGDAETPVANLTLSVSSSNPLLAPTNNIVLGGSGSSRTVMVTPATNQAGTATITLLVSDGSFTGSNSFLLTVSAIDHPPTITALPDQTIDEDMGTGPLSITIGDLESAAGSLTMSGGSSNPSLVPNANIVFGGSGSNRTVAVTPAPNQFGTATITNIVTDTNGGMASFTFILTVNPVNDPPTLNPIGNLAISEDAGLQSVSLSGIGSGAANESQALTVSASSSNPSVIPNPTVTYTSPNSAGSLTFIPVSNASGTATITVLVNDGQSQLNTFSRTFTVTVNPVNDAPAISNIADRSTNEDTPVVIPFTVGDSETAALSLVLAGSSSNPALVANTNIVFDGNGTNRMVVITPSANQFGSATITVAVNDGAATNSDTFVLTVNAVNDVPTLNPITNLTINTGASDQFVNINGISSGAPNESQTLTLTATSSAPSLVLVEAITYTSPATNGTIRLDPANGPTGVAIITAFISDGQPSNNVVSRTFKVYVKASGNASPTISAIANQTINEDANTGPIAVTVSDTQTPATLLALEGTSSNPALVPNGNIVFGGSGSSRTVTVTPLPNQFGTAIISVSVTDTNFGSTNGTFQLTVNSVNDLPTITNIADQSANEDGATGPIAFAVADVETPAGSLTVTGISSNTGLVPNANIVFGGNGTNRALAITPLPNQSGAVTITVTVTDGNGAFTNDTFVLTINPINDLPTISSIPDRTINEDTPSGAITFTVGDLESAADSLNVIGSSSNQSLVPNANIVPGGSGSSRHVTITPAPDQIGTALITVMVSDLNGGTTNGTFLLTVSSVNDAPTLDLINDLTIDANAGLQTVNLAGISAGPANENQTLTVTATSGNTSLILHPTVTYVSPNSTGSLQFTPVNNATGSVVITVTVQDNAGTFNGGQNTFVRTFSVTINAVAALAELRIERAGANMVISWPVSAAGFVLQAREALVPGSPWSPVSDLPVVVGDRFMVTNAPVGVSKFYRLAKEGPRLTIMSSGGNVVVSWPATPSGYALECRTNLFTGIWGAVGTPPVLISDRNYVTNSAAGSSKFFRLISQ